MKMKQFIKITSKDETDYIINLNNITYIRKKENDDYKVYFCDDDHIHLSEEQANRLFEEIGISL